MAKTTTPSKVKKKKTKKDKSGKKKKRKIDDEATAPTKKKAKVDTEGSAKKKKKKKKLKKAGDADAAATPKKTKKTKKTKKAKTPDDKKSNKKRKAKTPDDKKSKKKKGKKVKSEKKKKKKVKKAKEEEPVAKEEEAAAPAEAAEEKVEEEAAPAPAAAAAADVDDGATVKLFVGNLSFDITEEVVKEFFKDCGTITDVFWLESKDDGRFMGKGFITFETVDQARLAFAKKDEEVMGRPILIDYAKPREKKGGGREPRPLSEKPEGCTTVFLGNLDFNIEEDDVKKFAKDCGEIKSIRWLTHRDTGDFKGCGFCEFTAPEGVDNFIKLNGKMLNGRAIRIDYAQTRKNGGGGGGGKREPRPLSEKPDGCTTVFVGNLSFDITEDVIQTLAKDCGDGVKHVRWLTDRETQEFKGCGFVEFYDTESVDKFVLHNGEDVMGRSIRIDYAKPRPPRE